jgi:hypothetical protein
VTASCRRPGSSCRCCAACTSLACNWLTAIPESAPILRRMPAASAAAAMISLVFSRRSASGLSGTRPRPDRTRPVRGWGAAVKDAGQQSVRLGRAGYWGRGRRSGRCPDDQIGLGHVQSGIRQAGDDADLPRIACRSTTTKDHARPPAAHARLMASTCWSALGRSPCPGVRSAMPSEVVVFIGSRLSRIAGRALPVATTSVARSWTAGEHPLRILHSWVSPPADGS